MEATGERMILNTTFDAGGEAEHLERYRYACQFASGAQTIDIACGSGYGSKMLLDAGATSVLGMDISEEAVAYAQERYGAPGISFRPGDAQNLKGIPDNSVDLIVSFETIEHLPNVNNYLDEMRRVLKPGGQYIVSTPDRRLATVLYPLASKPRNPFHVEEFTDSEMREILARRFEIVEFAGQNYVRKFWTFWPWQMLVRGLCKAFRPIEKKRLISKVYYVGSGYKVEPATRHPSAIARFWVVRCRKTN